MCGLVAILGSQPGEELATRAMLDRLMHRGPNGSGVYSPQSGAVTLGHTRLAIIDTSSRSNQPMTDPSGRFTLVFNGEVYNYRELRIELSASYEFRTMSDTEVVLASLITWGPECLNKFLGMFSFLLWDELKQELYGARDRFGVKPLFYSRLTNGQVALASEIKAIQAIAPLTDLNTQTWAAYMSGEIYDSGPQTFWEGILRIPGGHQLRWSPGKEMTVSPWYTISLDETFSNLSDSSALESVRELLLDSVTLRMRSDVAVGICLSGGLDSSLVAALAAKARVKEDNCRLAFTFSFGPTDYDELPFAAEVAGEFGYDLIPCRLSAQEIPTLSVKMLESQDEPFGGLPTLGMGKIFETAQGLGVPVLLDGNGLDEAFGGYDYYSNLSNWNSRRAPVQSSSLNSGFLNVITGDLKRPEEIESDAESAQLVIAQIQDLLVSKIPRAMRFSDRASMMFSCELREPFLDHRLVEFGLAQPVHRKIGSLGGKHLVRQAARSWLPDVVSTATKRAVQSPQREWLQTDLGDWVTDNFNLALQRFGDTLLDRHKVRSLLSSYRNEGASSSYQIWTVISLGLMIHLQEKRRLGLNL